jgi:SPOR domain
VPATELKGWAAEMAWRVARAAALGGRRTALVDGFVDAPTLHTVAGTANDEGLVDAFQYGASLNRIVQQQPQANLFFIPSGTYDSNPQDVMTNPRWRRLSAGFRHEEALLLLYVSADHLDGLAAEPEGMIVLSPQGLDVSVASAPAVAAAVGRGLPLLAVVADEEVLATRGATDAAPGEASQPAAEAPPEAEGAEGAPAPVFRRRSGSKPMQMLVDGQPQGGLGKKVFVGTLVGIVLAALALVIMKPDALRSFMPIAGPSADSAARAALDSARLPPPPPPLPPVESLPFAVQVAATRTLPAAFAAADSLEADTVPVVVAPIRLAQRGAFFRVYAGPYATRARADSALQRLRARGVIAADAGSLDSVPLSVALTAGLTPEAARAERARLRTAGVPVFLLRQADGTVRLFAGAYGAATQAVLLQDLLTPTGSAGDLVPRVGSVP